MMVVPRSYSGSLSHRKSFDYSEKHVSVQATSGSPTTRIRSPLSTSPSPTRTASNLRHEPRSDPVRIPSRSTKTSKIETRLSPTLQDETKERKSLKPRKESAKDVLTSTAIPVRRRPRGRPSQRLPPGDHVADFSKLLRDDFKSARTGSLPREDSASNLDGLFGNMDELLEEGQMYIGSEGVDPEVLSKRSLSNESLTSLVSPDELAYSNNTSHLSSIARSTPDRKLRQIASSIDCSEDHPLSKDHNEEGFGSLPELNISPPTTRKQVTRPGSQLRLSFKSSLTASLKAIKSAAQSVSSTANPKTPENVLAHSFFEIEPSLTDDRRPPPLARTPSAEMRRYLNPTPLDSAAQLHFWQDHRHSQFNPPPASTGSPRKSKASKKKHHHARQAPFSSTSKLPLVVPLATCLPPSVRTAHASSPPIWLAPDGTPSNKHTARPLLYDPDTKIGNAENGGGCASNNGWRNREPRENRDFLRVYVCEMQMRRHGKLSEDLSAGRARLWLPPVDDGIKADADKNQLVRNEGKDVVAAADSSDVKNFKGRRDGRQRLSSWTVDQV